MTYQNRQKKLAIYLALLLAIFAGGYYLGSRYGLDVFQTQRQQQRKVAEVEKKIAEDRAQGFVLLVGGRVLEVGSDGTSIRIADETLGVVYKAPGGSVERTLIVNDATLLVKEEVSGGPHFIISVDRLRAGQFVSVYLAKNDFAEDNAVAKEVVVHEYVPMETVSGNLGAGAQPSSR